MSYVDVFAHFPRFLPISPHCPSLPPFPPFFHGHAVRRLVRWQLVRTLAWGT